MSPRSLSFLRASRTQNRLSTILVGLRSSLALTISVLLLTWLAWRVIPAPNVTGQTVTTNCPRVIVPALTHGFQRTDDLPAGDHFLLPEPFIFGVVAPPVAGGIVPGLTTFNVNSSTFGGDLVSVGGLPGTNPTGIAYNTPGGRLTLLSCTDSIWDGDFMIASQGATVGDTVRLFVQRPDGSGAFTLAMFRVEENGLRLTQIFNQARLFRNDRLAVLNPVFIDDLIPFVANAGAAGRRTELLTLAIQMTIDSPLNECLQLGVTIARSNGVGTTSMLITDVIVNRNEVAGDRNLTAAGFLGGLIGGYPTGPVCQTICAVCAPPPTPTPTPPPVKCDTFCLRSPEFWLKSARSFPRGSVFISGVNFNQAISTRDIYQIELALGGICGPQTFGTISPQGQFNQGWVTLQLNLLYAGGGGAPNYFNVQWSPLSCYGLNFTPVTLSNGVVITPATMFKDLLMQAQRAAGRNNSADFLALAGLFNLLNGDDPRGFCN
jgi:hypothetical protein